MTNAISLCPFDTKLQYLYSKRRLLKCGFTLVELLVVIAIIGVLVAMLLPAVQAARESARRTTCMNNFRQAAVACHMYHDAHKKLPVGAMYSVYMSDPGIPPDTKPHMQGISWSAYVLPFMEQASVFALIDDETSAFSAGSWLAGGQLVPSYICPSNQNQSGNWTDQSSNRSQDGAADHDFRITNITGVMGYYPFGPDDRYPPTLDHGSFMSFQQKSQGNGMFYNLSDISFKKVTDGTSKTLMLGETTGHRGKDAAGIGVSIEFNWITRNVQSVDEGINGPFTLPGGRNPDLIMGVSGQNRHEELTDQFGFSSYHPGGAHFAMGDASVQFLNENIDQAVFEEMGSRNDDGRVYVPPKTVR